MHPERLVLSILGFTLVALLPRIGRRLVLHLAYHAVLRAYPALERHPRRRRLLCSRDGVALLALLCNAAAKRTPTLYRHKAFLIHAAVIRSRRSDWWIDTHVTRPGDVPRSVLLLDTTIGPILDLEHVQLSFHLQQRDLVRFFRHAPTAQGRRWMGIPLQPRAEALTLAWLNR
jgi:hypothetical protein